MKPIRVVTIVTPFVLVLTAALGLLLVAQASASTSLAVADLNSGGVEDVFAHGRRYGWLFVAVGIGIAALSQAITARLKPKDGAPSTGWRARASVYCGAAGMIALALVDMFAESRGMGSVANAAIGALALVRYSRDDPPRGSKRTEDAEASGEIEAP